MKVLITGGAGFIGSHAVQYHLEKNDEVYAVDNFIGGSLNNIKAFLNHKNFHFYEDDLLTWSMLPAVLEKVDRVYHLAAFLGMFNVLAKPLLTLTNNIDTTKCILHIVKDFKKKPVILVASSSEVYGNQEGLLSEDTPLTLGSTTKNHAAYPIGKMCDESLSAAYHYEYQVPCIIARIFNTIGPRQTGKYGMVVPRFIEQALLNEPLTVFGDGTQQRSFCDVRDLINLFNLVMNNKKCLGQAINIGHMDVITIENLALLIKKLSNSQSIITKVPFSEVYKGGYLQIDERKIDATKLLKYTNYKYEWHLEKTLHDLINYKKSELNDEYV